MASEPKEVAGFITSREITSAALMHSRNAAETELLFALRHYKMKMADYCIIYCISCIPFEHALVLCIRLDLMENRERAPVLLLLHARITSG